MNKRLLLAAACLVGASAFFSSCDENDNPGTNPDENVKTVTLDATAYDKWVYFDLETGKSEAHEIDPLAGTYSGDLSLNVNGEDQGTVEGMKLEVKRISADSVSFVLKDLAFGRYGEIGDITSGAISETDSLDGTWAYLLEGGEITVNNGKYSVKASSEGWISGKDIELTTQMQLGSMPVPIKATYKGTLEAGSVDETAFEWDLALHRYDVKTNGGSAVKTNATELSALTSLPADGYTADEEMNELIVDMSGMMTGKVGYAHTTLNKVLGSWMSMDGMPPTFTRSENVYVLKNKSGQCASIKFTDYRNDDNKTGYITFDYIFPAQ